MSPIFICDTPCEIGEKQKTKTTMIFTSYNICIKKKSCYQNRLIDNALFKTVQVFYSLFHHLQENISSPLWTINI